METIKENLEEEEKEAEQQSEREHPLLIKQVLTTLFEYFNLTELKRARLVCREWREWATPLLQVKSIVRLRGTCQLCNSEWKLNEKLVPDHDHGRTISFYRFVNRLLCLSPERRESLFFRNFAISGMNLYLMGAVINTEPNKYFHQFVRLFGRKVFHLELDEIQLCPTEAIPELLAIFPNLDDLSLSDITLWADPLRRRGSKKTAGRMALPEGSNGFLKSLTFTKRWMSEELLPWPTIFEQCPHLQELRLEQLGQAEVKCCLETLVRLRAEAPERLKIRHLAIFPEINPLEKMRPEAGACEGLTTDPPPYLDADEEEDDEREAGGLERATWKLLREFLKVSRLEELRVHMGYDDRDGDYLKDVLQGLTESVRRLSLSRRKGVLMTENQLTFNWRRPQEQASLVKLFMFPALRTLEIAHNFLDSLDEIRALFPSLTALRLNIVPTEFLSTTKKPYETYVRTNLLMNMKNSAPFPTIRQFLWNVEEARNRVTGKRTVIYKTNAIRHVPTIFPSVTVLAVSVTRASDLQVIFSRMSQLEELTLLRNSFHRLTDEDLIGPAPSHRHCITLRLTTTMTPNRTPLRGIRQLQQLKRLSLENNNSALTNAAIVEGLVYLQNLRSLHIARATRLTMRGLQLLGACPHLLYVHVTGLRLEADDELDRIVTDTLIRQGMEKEAVRRRELERSLGIVPEKKVGKSRIPTRIPDGGPALPEEPAEVVEREPEWPEVDLTQEREIPIILHPTPEESVVSQRLSLILTAKKTRSSMSPSWKKTEHVLTVKEILNMTEEEKALRELELLWRRKQEEKLEAKRRKGVRIGGRYEMGPKYYKLGGRRYDIIRTVYKLHGRTYHLVRRVYESETGDRPEGWEAAHAKRNNRRRTLPPPPPPPLTFSHHHDDDNEDDPEDEAGAEMTESEYERSVKEDEEDEEEAEDYCDLSEDEEDSAVVELSGSDDPCATDEDEDNSLEFVLDDPMYEGDKEFYDSSPPPEEDEDEDEDDAEKSGGEDSKDEDDPGTETYVVEDHQDPDATGRQDPNDTDAYKEDENEDADVTETYKGDEDADVDVTETYKEHQKLDHDAMYGESIDDDDDDDYEPSDQSSHVVYLHPTEINSPTSDEPSSHLGSLQHDYLLFGPGGGRRTRKKIRFLETETMIQDDPRDPLDDHNDMSYLTRPLPSRHFKIKSAEIFREPEDLLLTSSKNRRIRSDPAFLQERTTTSILSNSSKRLNSESHKTVRIREIRREIVYDRTTTTTATSDSSYLPDWSDERVRGGGGRNLKFTQQPSFDLSTTTNTDYDSADPLSGLQSVPVRSHGDDLDVQMRARIAGGASDLYSSFDDSVPAYPESEYEGSETDIMTVMMTPDKSEPRRSSSLYLPQIHIDYDSYASGGHHDDI